MAVSSTTNRIQYVGNNSIVTPYPVPFYFQDEEWIKVQIVDADGVTTTLALGTDYAITGAGDPDGGDITTVVAYDNTYDLTIYRDVPITQLLDLVYNDKVPSALLELALDKLTFIAQQLSSFATAGEHALTFPVTEPDGNTTTLPTAAARLDTVVYFNATTGEMELITPAELALTVDPSFEALVEAKADVSALTAGLALKQDLAQVKSANFTAAIDSVNVTTATATVTDPTPVEGKGYTVFVRAGTTTINAVAYATAGTIIKRIYQSASWVSYVYYTAAALADLTQTLTNKTLTNPAINNITHGYRQQATAAGTTTLVVGDDFTQVFTGSTTQTVTLPTTSILAGHSYLIINKSTGLITVQSSGGNTVAIISNEGKAVIVARTNTPTTAANWTVVNSNSVLLASVASTSGTAFDFTVPASVNEVFVSFQGTGLSSTDHFLVQIGSTTPETSGYISTTTDGTTVVADTTGFVAYVGNAGNNAQGHMHIVKHQGYWSASHTLRSSSTRVVQGGGGLPFGDITIVRITRTGASTFDQGAVGISYKY